MTYIKVLPSNKINHIRNNPDKSGVLYKEFGKSTNIKDYSDYEITEMYFGVYRYSKKLLVDGDYLVDINKVKKTKCILKGVSYYKNPKKEDYETNDHNSILNIRTFYIKNYFLITEEEIFDNREHRVGNCFRKLGAIKQGRGRNAIMFSMKNDYKCFDKYDNGSYPKDLFHPIKNYINGLFFSDDYRISDFEVESDIEIHNRYF